VESAGGALRRHQKEQKALQESLQAALERLESLRSGEAGALTKEQKEAVAAVYTSLDRLARAADRREAAGSPRVD
jgi:hypothetical protein